MRVIGTNHARQRRKSRSTTSCLSPLLFVSPFTEGPIDSFGVRRTNRSRSTWAPRTRPHVATCGFGGLASSIPSDVANRHGVNWLGVLHWKSLSLNLHVGNQHLRQNNISRKIYLERSFYLVWDHLSTQIYSSLLMMYTSAKRHVGTGLADPSQRPTSSICSSETGWGTASAPRNPPRPHRPPVHVVLPPSARHLRDDQTILALYIG